MSKTKVGPPYREYMRAYVFVCEGRIESDVKKCTEVLHWKIRLIITYNVDDLTKRYTM